MSPGILARLQLLAVAILFSTGGLAIKATAMSAWQVASWRCGVAAAVLLALAPAARRAIDRRALLVGLPFAATAILYTLANKYTTAANAIFLQDTAPLYVLLLSPWLLRERVARRDAWFLILLACGMALFFARTDQPLTTAPRPLYGNLLAAAAGLTWALTLVGLRWLARGEEDGEQRTLAAVVAGSLLAWLIGLVPALPVTGIAARDWLIVLYLGSFQIALAYLLLARAMRHLPALEVSLLLLIEPVLSPVWVWLLLGEVPGSLALAGGSLIVAGTALRAWQQRRRA